MMSKMKLKIATITLTTALTIVSMMLAMALITALIARPMAENIEPMFECRDRKRFAIEL